MAKKDEPLKTKVIWLDTEERPKDAHIIELSNNTMGYESTIDFLSKQYGQCLKKMWNTIQEQYPETKEGEWQFDPTDQKLTRKD